MKRISLQSDLGKLLFGDLDTLGVFARIDFSAHTQPGSGGGSRNEIDDHLMTHERFAAPVLTDKGKQSMLDLVPLAGTGRQMANRYLQTGFVG